MSETKIVSQRVRNLPPVLRIIFLIVALLTIVLPFDLVPDLAPVIGWLDDLAAFVYLVFELIQSIRSWRSSPKS